MRHVNRRPARWLALAMGVALSWGCFKDDPHDAGDMDSGDADPPCTLVADRCVDASVDSTVDVPEGPPPSEVLPAFDGETEAHVRELVARGQAQGNRHDVVAKIGDSITESGSFLFDCGYGWYTLGEHTELLPTIQYFSARMLGDGRNSLNRASRSAVAGWDSGDALHHDGDTPLLNELNAIQPQWAIVMYGTNDVERSDVPTLWTNMNQIVDVLEAHGVVPVISTIPPRRDTEERAARVPAFNDAIRALAAHRHLPFIDYWHALDQIDGNGLGADGVHPNVYSGGSCDFTEPAMQFGYNVRNLTALQMLTRLRAY
jgi:hypothetical protein